VAISVGEFDSVTRKFGFETYDTHHKLAWLCHDGKKVVRTRRSHVKGRDVPAEHAIRSQLHLSSAQWRDAVKCTLGREQYLDILAKKGLL
jgi:hypothetical protein